MRKHENMNNFKQYELSYEQIDQIMIEELQEAARLNWNNDHEIVEAAFRLLAYYMPREDYNVYREQLNSTPPQDASYDNTN